MVPAFVAAIVVGTAAEAVIVVAVVVGVVVVVVDIVGHFDVCPTSNFRPSKTAIFVVHK